MRHRWHGDEFGGPPIFANNTGEIVAVGFHPGHSISNTTM